MTLTFIVSPLGTYKYGVEFHKRAGRLSAPRLSYVQHFLLGHAIELYLKAFLMVSGVAQEVLRKKVGHDLSKCLQQAKSRGLEKHVAVSVGLEDAISAFNKYYKGKHFEYFDLGIAITGGHQVDATDLVSFASKLRRKVGPMARALALQ